MDLLIKLFDVLFPVFLIIGIGYWYGKRDPKFDTKFITTFSGNVGLPCIIFYSLTLSDIEDKPVSPLPLNNLIKKFSI